MTTSEKRNFERYIAKEHAFALLKPYCNKLGQIKNISRGGVAFEYLVFDKSDEGAWLSEQLRLDIILTPEALYLSQVPCEIVYDNVVNKNLPLLVQGIESRLCGLKFGKLTEDQSGTLETFLEKYVLRTYKTVK